MKFFAPLLALLLLITLAEGGVSPLSPRARRSPQDPPPPAAEGDKPPVWCSFALPWR